MFKHARLQATIIILNACKRESPDKFYRRSFDFNVERLADAPRTDGQVCGVGPLQPGIRKCFPLIHKVSVASRLGRQIGKRRACQFWRRSDPSANLECEQGCGAELRTRCRNLRVCERRGWHFATSVPVSDSSNIYFRRMLFGSWVCNWGCPKRLG